MLAADDVESQWEILCSMLETVRYQARAVSGDKEVIDYLNDHRVDLLFLDMITDPGISGFETYWRIKEIHPRQEAIIANGFAEAGRPKETLKLGASRYVFIAALTRFVGLSYEIIPTMAPARQVASVPATMDFNPRLIISILLSGTMLPMPPIMIPRLPRFANPQRA